MKNKLIPILMTLPWLLLLYCQSPKSPKTEDQNLIIKGKNFRLDRWTKNCYKLTTAERADKVMEKIYDIDGVIFAYQSGWYNITIYTNDSVYKNSSTEHKVAEAVRLFFSARGMTATIKGGTNGK